MPEDPGLVLQYDEAVHEALVQPNAPIPQAATVALSAEAFKRYVFHVIITTPVELSEHCVLSHATPGQPEEYFTTVFERLEYNTYRKIIQRLRTVFVTAQTPTALWSAAVSQPPSAPCVCL